MIYVYHTNSNNHIIANHTNIPLPPPHFIFFKSKKSKMFLKKIPKTKPLIFVGKKSNWNAQRSHGGLIHPYVATHTNLVHVMNVIVANANSPLLSSPWLTLAKGVCLYNDLHCCIRKRHVTLIITLHLCEPFIFHSNLIYTHTHNQAYFLNVCSFF